MIHNEKLKGSNDIFKQNEWFSNGNSYDFQWETTGTTPNALIRKQSPINQPLMGPMISARHLSMSLWMLPLMSSMSAMASLIGISWMRPIGEHHQMKLFSMRNHQVLITWNVPIKTHGFPMAIHGTFNEKPLEQHQMHLLENNPLLINPSWVQWSLQGIWAWAYGCSLWWAAWVQWPLWLGSAGWGPLVSTSNEIIFNEKSLGSN